MRIQQLTQGHVLSAQCCTSLGAAAVVLQHIHGGAKALELPTPVAQSAEGADDEEGAVHATAAQVAQEGDGLDLQGGERGVARQGVGEKLHQTQSYPAQMLRGVPAATQQQILKNKIPFAQPAMPHAGAHWCFTHPAVSSTLR